MRASWGGGRGGRFRILAGMEFHSGMSAWEKDRCTLEWHPMGRFKVIWLEPSWARALLRVMWLGSSGGRGADKGSHAQDQ